MLHIQFRLILQELPQAVSLTVIGTQEEERKAFEQTLLVTRFRGDEGMLYYVHNSGNGTATVTMRFPLEADASTPMTLPFSPYQTYLLSSAEISERQLAVRARIVLEADTVEEAGRMHAFAGKWRITPLRDNALPLRQWTVEYGIAENELRTWNRHRYETVFEAKYVPEVAKLVIDGIYLTGSAARSFPTFG